MIQFFSRLIPATGKFSFYVFKAFGLFAIILGILNFKDYLFYTPGSFMTEMPLTMRPKMKSLIKKITSPRGAFVIGLFVTFFLLPCTIGPYIIASGKLSVLSFLTTIPWLFLYNIVFILPMIAITSVIYLGLTTVEKVSGWKDKNIKNLHLIEGTILILLGIAMFTGLI
jgi:cytochrome c biogenesis protein CcdA